MKKSSFSCEYFFAAVRCKYVKAPKKPGNNGLRIITWKTNIQN